MKTYRKFKRNAKALSPVIASIILIAVTVAVSVVVAAWMGGISLGFMGNAEQLSITNVEFVTGNTEVKLSILNSGGADATISAVYVNGQSGYTANPTSIPKGTSTDVTIPLAWTASTSYDFKLTTSKGNNIATTGVAP
jgi:flagellin-like protein